MPKTNSVDESIQQNIPRLFDDYIQLYINIDYTIKTVCYYSIQQTHILHLANDFWQSLVPHSRVVVVHLRWGKNQHGPVDKGNLMFGSKILFQTIC